MATPVGKSLYPTHLLAPAAAHGAGGTPSAPLGHDTLSSAGASAPLYPSLPTADTAVHYPVMPSAPPAEPLLPMVAACQQNTIHNPEEFASYLHYGATTESVIPDYTKDGHKGVSILLGTVSTDQKAFSDIKKISEENRFGGFNPLVPTSHPELHGIIDGIVQRAYAARNLMPLDRLIAECDEIIRELDHKDFPKEQRGLIEVALRRAFALKIITEKLPTFINRTVGTIFFSSEHFANIHRMYAFATRNNTFITDLPIALLLTRALTAPFIEATVQKYADGEIGFREMNGEIATFEASVDKSLSLCSDTEPKALLKHTVMNDAKDKLIEALSQNIATAAANEINRTHDSRIALYDLVGMHALCTQLAKPAPILECLNATFSAVIDAADKTLDKKISYFQNVLTSITSTDQEISLRGVFLQFLLDESRAQFNASVQTTGLLPVDWRESMVQLFAFGTRGNTVDLPYPIHFQNELLTPLGSSLVQLAQRSVQERQTALGASRAVTLQEKTAIYDRVINEFVAKQEAITPADTQGMNRAIVQRFLRGYLAADLACEWSSKNTDASEAFATTGYLPESVYFDAQMLQNFLTRNGEFRQVNDFLCGKLTTLFGDIGAIESAIAVNTGLEAAPSTSAAVKALLQRQLATLEWARSMLDPATTNFSPPPAISRGAAHAIVIPAAATPAISTPPPAAAVSTATAALPSPVVERSATVATPPVAAPVVLRQVNLTSELHAGIDFASPTWYRDLPVQHKIFVLGNILSGKTGALETHTAEHLTTANPGRLWGPFACEVKDLAIEEIRANQADFVATLTTAEKREAGEALLAYLLVEAPYKMRTIDRLKAAGLGAHGPFLEAIYVQAIREGQIIEAWDAHWAENHWEADAKSSFLFHDRIIQGLERFIAS